MKVGDVLYMDQAKFYATPGVRWTRLPDKPAHEARRPFLCIAVREHEADFHALTKIERRERIRIEPGEKTQNSPSPGWDGPSWIDDPTYLWTIPLKEIHNLCPHWQGTRIKSGAMRRILRAIEIVLARPRKDWVAQ